MISFKEQMITTSSQISKNQQNWYIQSEFIK